MPISRSAARSVAFSILWLCLSFALATPVAAESRFSIFLDRDGNSQTGCAVATPDGPFVGAEEIWTTVVAEARVLRLEAQACKDGAWRDAAGQEMAAGGWPVGFGVGDDGADLLETEIPLPPTAEPSSLRLGLAGRSAQGSDALLTVDGMAAEPTEGSAVGAAREIRLHLQPVAEIPTLSWAGVLLLAVVLLLVAWRRLRFARAVAMVLLVSGVAWAAHAATVLLDGSPEGWSAADRVARDLAEDAPAGVDLISAYARAEGRRLVLRLDVRGLGQASVEERVGSAPGPWVTQGKGEVADGALSAAGEIAVAGPAAETGSVPESQPDLETATSTLATRQIPQGYEPIQPMGSGSQALGSVDTVPVVAYNEFTGNLTATLDVGVEGLTLPIRYSSRLDPDLQGRFYGMPRGYSESVMGLGWYVGYGILSAPRPDLVAPPFYHPDAPPTPQEKVLFREPDGSEAEFKQDFFFQAPPPGGNYHNYHYLDGQFRRITRTIDTKNPQAYTDGNYVLLNRDGSRITFEPRFREGSTPGTARFYPTRIEAANGRALLLTYRDRHGVLAPGGAASGGKGGGGADTSDSPLLETVEDSWGRRLRLDWEEWPSTGRHLLRGVSLEVGSTSRDLVAFDYRDRTFCETGGSCSSHTVLHSATTPEGYVTEIGYLPPFPTQAPLLGSVRLPTGGEVAVTYLQSGREFCPNGRPNNTTPWDVESVGFNRVETLSHGGETYRYQYRQGNSLGPDYDGTWIVEMSTTHSPTPYHRLTQYYHAKVNRTPHPDSTENCSPTPRPTSWDLKEGRAWRRLESYGGSDFLRAAPNNFTFTPGGTHRREEWEYGIAHLRSTSHLTDLRQDAIEVVPYLTRYAVRRDGKTWYTDFDYDLVEGPPARFLLPYLDRPRASTRYRHDHPQEKVVQTYQVETRVENDHSLTHRIDDKPHLPTLPTQVERFFYQDSGLQQNAKETTRYAPGRLPFVEEKAYFSSPYESSRTSYAYYGTGSPYEGLLQWEERPTVSGSRVRTTYESYAYGQPSRIQPPLGPPILRQVDGDGTVASETRDGITAEFLYDLDRRLTRTLYPGSGQLPETLRYSPPGGSTFQEAWLGDPDAGGHLLSRIHFDSWGRESRVETVQDDGVVGERRYHYTPLGLVELEVGERGAVTAFSYDVLGRVRIAETTQDGDPQQPLERIDTAYRALSGGQERVEETRQGSSSAVVVTQTDSDFFGRTVRAATTHGETFETLFTHLSAGERLRTVIRPEGGPTRLEDRDWFGRLRLECHPEMRCSVVGDAPADLATTVRYDYDDRDRLVLRQGPGDESVAFVYDDLDRLIAERRGSGGIGIGPSASATFVYDDQNRLEEAAAVQGSARVVTRFGEFDALGRPLLQGVEVPQAKSAPTELSPERYWFFGETLPMSWETESASSVYVVELQRLGGKDASPVLRFETPELALELDQTQIRSAVAALPVPAYGQPFVDDLDADPDFLLDPEVAYRWRVYGLAADLLEPTFYSPWADLDRSIGPDDCYLKHFRVIDGVGEGALVEWETANCPTTGPFRVRVLASTVEDEASASCSFTDGVFAADTRGPKRAQFMVTGYSMDGDLPIFPDHPASPGCPGIDVADFRAVIVDEEDVEVHAVEAQRGRVLSGEICNLRNINIIAGLNGTAPFIRWETEHCEAQTVEVLVSSDAGDAAPVCQRVDDLLATGPSGQVAADFMVDGWTVGGVSCPAVDEASVVVRAVEVGGEELWRSTPRPVLVEPEGGFPGGCYTRLFTDSSAPGVVPIIAWEAHHCEGLDVRVTWSTVGLPTDLRCVVRNELWQTDYFGVADVPFMVNGYGGRDGVLCDPLAEVLAGNAERVEMDFDINIFDPQTGLAVEPQFRVKNTTRATYMPPPAPDYTGPCRIESFGVTNGFFGYRPVATWVTSGSDCAAVRLRVWTEDDLEPASCRLNGEVWSELRSGASSLDFMVHGYDYGLVENYDGVKDCVGDPGPLGLYGEALTKAEVQLEVVDQAGNVQVSPAIPAPVKNHNDHNQTGIIPPDEPCEITAFDVHQPRVAGAPRTDSLPTVRWNSTCPGFGRYAVRVWASAEPVAGGAPCQLEDFLFSSATHGPQVARFLRTGYFDYVTGTQTCQARQASFRIEIYDEVEELAVAGSAQGPIAVSYTGPYDGEPPVPPCAGDTCSNPNCQAPEFLGLQSVTPAGGCAATLSWPAATPDCGDGVTYSVYRASHSGVRADEGYRQAEGLTGTQWTDDLLANGGTYHWLVSAHDSTTGQRTAPDTPLSLQVSCGGAANTLTVSAGGDPANPIDPGDPVTLSWNFPEALGVFMVGIPIEDNSGSVVVSPSATTIYEAHVEFPGSFASFQVTVYVDDSGPAPQRFAACDRPCSDVVMIDGEPHYCRGYFSYQTPGNPDLTQTPIWLAVSDWQDLIGSDTNPASPYCFRGTCGDGGDPITPWHIPGDPAEAWMSESRKDERVELPNDGWDNDCDQTIDESP